MPLHFFVFSVYCAEVAIFFFRSALTCPCVLSLFVGAQPTALLAGQHFEEIRRRIKVSMQRLFELVPPDGELCMANHPAYFTFEIRFDKTSSVNALSVQMSKQNFAL